MTTYNVDDLATASALTGAELVEVLQSGVNKKITASLLQGAPGRGVPAGGVYGNLMFSDGAGNGVWLANGTTGQALVAVTAGVPTWSDTFTTAKTIDLGTGALPAALSATGLRLAPLSGGPRIEGVAVSGPGLIFSGRAAGGTRAAPTATPSATPFSQMTGFGHDGTDWLTARSVAFVIAAGSLWSGTNRETMFQFSGVSTGSTAEAEWMRLQNGNLGIGVAPTVGNGLVQLAAGTTKANAVAFGTDTFLHREGAGLLLLAPGSGIGQFAVQDSTAASKFFAYADINQVIIGQIHNKPLSIRTSNQPRFQIDGSGNFHLRGGTPTTPSAFTAWTGTATRSSIATGSATVANCAEAIKALVDDLKAIGVLP